MPPRRKAPLLTERQRHRANPITLRIKQDDYDRAQVLAQLATDLAADVRIGRSVLFKGGAVLQMGHQSPRFSRDLDATAIAQQTIQTRWVEDVLAERPGAHHVRSFRGTCRSGSSRDCAAPSNGLANIQRDLAASRCVRRAVGFPDYPDARQRCKRSPKNAHETVPAEACARMG